MDKIVLASASPRRSVLLEQIGLPFEVLSSNVDEIIAPGFRPEQVVQELASRKAWEVARRTSPERIILGADTVVVKDGMILGKPGSSQEAFHMLTMLQNSWHEVLTGICLVRRSDEKAVSSYEVTRVKMKPLSGQEIDAYIHSGEPVDKAGSYGIQGRGAILIERIEGCYFNVVGLPVYKLVESLKAFNIRYGGGFWK